MPKVVLTIIDTAAIQDYIFGSNRLRENIGASYLVECATRDWVYQSLEASAPQAHNLANLQTGALNQTRTIADEGTDAELIFAGGGNTAILFRSLPLAQEFARRLSHKVLTEAPGLEVVMAHSKPFVWEEEGNTLRAEVNQLRDGRLAMKRRARRAPPLADEASATPGASTLPLLGLGVTAECASSGLVASKNSATLEPKVRLISREMDKKLQATRQTRQTPSPAKQRLVEMVRAAGIPDHLVFSDELDHLGRKGGEESYVAIVHADGNEMGKFIKDHVETAATNREYITRMRDLSAGIQQASVAALVHTLHVLLAHIKPLKDKKGEDIWQVIEAVAPVDQKDFQISEPQKTIPLYQRKKDEEESGKFCLPFRPLVFGGDEVTFVCNGQLGLSLAVIFMREFTRQTTEILRQPVHLGAGVCVVKAHYPFRRAYRIAEALTKAAKTSLGDDKRQASAIDWHFSTTGVSGALEFIRQREYQVGEGNLLMRPARLTAAAGWQSWENFHHLVALFNYDKRWAGRRNKIKALRQALREGKDAGEEFCKTYLQKDDSKTLPPLKNSPSHLAETGWDGNRCGYFDAVEAMDHHFLLEEKP